jgi:trk system potassium uptake protein TrkH
MIDLRNDLTLFGQLVVLVLIQLGGLGLMTVSTVIMVLLGWKVNFRSRLMMQEALNQNDTGGIVRVVLRVAKFTFAIEAIGAVLLSFRFCAQFGFWRGIYLSIFHSISAFNNAGFDLMGNFSSMTTYATDPLVNVTIIVLIVFGGIGIAVLTDFWDWHGKKPYAAHTKIVIVTTIGLIVFGTLAILMFEWNNPLTLGPLNFFEKFVAALFQSISPRTAGFNTLNIVGMHAATILLLIIFMFIGASPMSTAGGVKTTTFAIMLAVLRASLKNEEDIVLFGRLIPRNIVQRAMSIVFLSMLWIMSAFVFLSMTENMSFIELLFETVSAFGTVGLSIGATMKLTFLGKVIIILTMLFGRVGPLTFAVAFMVNKGIRRSKINYPEEKILVG